MPGLLVRALRIAATGLLACLLFWALLAVWFSGFGWPARALAVLVPVAGVVAWFRRPPLRRGLGVAGLACSLVVAALWPLKRPSHDRDWSADMVRLPLVERLDPGDDVVRIENIRDCAYRSRDDFDVRYRDETFDLRRLESLDLMVERFHPFAGLAHTLLSFGFSDGRHVAISVEIRREAGEAFGPIAGLFKQFELMYVVATEQDLIGLRTNHRGSRVWLYPIRATPEQMRALFRSMLVRIDSLASRPEFYNTLTSSCTTNIAAHVRELVPGRIPLDWRILLPGYLGEMAYELDLIDTTLPLAEAERRFRIDPLALEAGVGPDFSERIRSGRPPGSS